MDGSEIIPVCADELKPLVGCTYESIQDFETSYKNYAHNVGFSVRNSSSKKDIDGLVMYKYLVCSKEGYNKEKLAIHCTDKIKEVRRKRLNTREGCNAYSCVKRTNEGKYLVTKFHEGHSHALSTPRKKRFLRSNRKITDVQKSLLSTLERANIGPSQAFYIMKEQVGGFENIGFTIKDALNYSRDLKALVKDSDAHLLIQKLKIQHERDPSFYFSYELDNEDCLMRIFWSGGLARSNFCSFGDLMSFDTTYSTNKYNMIFAPFTGINNHRLSVTFGAALLANERSESFLWLFENFLDCMGGNQPTMIVTDQDPAITTAITQTFIGSKHRYCMWHIMKKLSEKIGGVLNSNSTFQSRFNSCVWNSESSEEFEEAWISIIFDYELTNNDWLAHIFELRSMWIPAYFSDIPLSGLLQTTSRSESGNSFFSHFVSRKVSLVEFYSRFESAMDAQREKELKFNHDMLYGKPSLKTSLCMEKDASELYTQSNFYIFQVELWASCIECGLKSFNKNSDELSIFTIFDSSKPNVKCRDVFYTSSSTNCTCKMFEKQGVPCRHMLFVWKGQGINKVPSKYITKRWTRMAIQQPFFEFSNCLNAQISEGEHKRRLISIAWAHVSRCMEIAKLNTESLTDFISTCSSWERSMTEQTQNYENQLTLVSNHEDSIPIKIDILPPKLSKTKGSGKRIKSGKELAIENKGKNTRLCRACGVYSLHDSRNCPVKHNFKFPADQFQIGGSG